MTKIKPMPEMATRNRDETVWEAISALVGMILLVVAVCALLYVVA